MNPKLARELSGERIAAGGNDPYSLTGKCTACSWCGLRVARSQVLASPTCTECAEGGRKFRVRMSLDRLRRAAQEPK